MEDDDCKSVDFCFSPHTGDSGRNKHSGQITHSLQLTRLIKLYLEDAELWDAGMHSPRYPAGPPHGFSVSGSDQTALLVFCISLPHLLLHCRCLLLSQQ